MFIIFSDFFPITTPTDKGKLDSQIISYHVCNRSNENAKKKLYALTMNQLPGLIPSLVLRLNNGLLDYGMS